MTHATFTSLETARAEDWAAIDSIATAQFAAGNAGAGLLRALEVQRYDDRMGWPINVYQHCLQSATRAARDGADDETVFCALFHDALEAFSPHEHSEAAATLLAPYVSADLVWLVRHHAIFQSRHCIAHPSRDRTAYLAFEQHPMFERTIAFCQRYDENCFDPAYETMPVEAFYPLVDRICRKAGAPAD